MKKIIFLDRDGVLNFDGGYTYQTGEYRLLPGIKKALQKLAKKNFYFVVATNQSGIGRGLYSEEDYFKFTDLLINDLAKDGIEILNHYFCPHHLKHGKGRYMINCECRKPKPGMVFMAEKEFGPFDYGNSWVIGNSERDAAMGKNAHPAIRTILVPKNYGTENQMSVERTPYADYAVNDMEEASEIICSQTKYES